MNADLAKALELIKSNGILQADKIWSLECKIEALTSELQQKTEAIELLNKHIENHHAANAVLQQKV
jgi:hypothetical protein